MSCRRPSTVRRRPSAAQMASLASVTSPQTLVISPANLSSSPRFGMGWSIWDHFGTGPGISPTGLHFALVSVVLASLRHTKAGPVSSLGSSPSSGGGLLTTTGLLRTGCSHRGELGAGTLATGLAVGLVFDGAGLAFDAFHPLFGTGAATSVLTQCCGVPKKYLHYMHFRFRWPCTSSDPACIGRRFARRAPSTPCLGWHMARK